MAKIGRSEMERRLEILGGALQQQIRKTEELEVVLSSLIKLIEKLPGYEAARDEIVKLNEELLKKEKDESENLSE